MGKPHPSYTACLGVTPQQTCDATAHVFGFAFDCYPKKKAAGASGGNESKRLNNARPTEDESSPRVEARRLAA